MPLPFDATMKDIVQHYTHDYEEALHLGGPQPVTVLNVDLSTISAATDVVLGYRSTRKIRRLADRSQGRLRVVDDASAYLRLGPAEIEPRALYGILKDLLSLPARSV